MIVHIPCTQATSSKMVLAARDYYCSFLFMETQIHAWINPASLYPRIEKLLDNSEIKPNPLA